MKTATPAARDGERSFEGYGCRVTVDHEVTDAWTSHRQILATATESFGVLIGTTSIDRRQIWIEAITTPMQRDRSSRSTFALRDPGHQRAVNRRFTSSESCAIYLGTWHTHPEPLPAPSRTDLKDWVTCLHANRGRPLVFVLVGTEDVRVFVRTRGRFKLLRRIA